MSTGDALQFFCLPCTLFLDYKQSQYWRKQDKKAQYQPKQVQPMQGQPMQGQPTQDYHARNVQWARQRLAKSQHEREVAAANLKAAKMQYEKSKSQVAELERRVQVAERFLQRCNAQVERDAAHLRDVHSRGKTHAPLAPAAMLMAERDIYLLKM